MTHGTQTRTTHFTPDPTLEADARFRAHDELEDAVGNGGHRPTRGGSSLGSLVRELAAESRDLVQLEMELAKAETRETLEVYTRNLGAIVVGGALLLAALFMAVVVINRGLTALLAGWLGVEVAVWLAPLVLTVALAGIGWATIQKGRRAIREESLVPEKTIDTLKQDKRWAERKVTS